MKDDDTSLITSPIDEMNISMDKTIKKKEDEVKKSLHSAQSSNNHPTHIHPTQSTNIQPIQYKQTKVPKKLKPKWRRADKRREISENIYINPQYEYPPDHVSDGRLSFVYKQLKKQYFASFSKQKPYLKKEIAFYKKLTSTLSQGILPASVNLSVFLPNTSISTCEGCLYSSPSLYHSYPLSNQTIRTFRDGKEISTIHNSFSSQSYSVTAICVTTYFLLLLI